MKYPFEVSISEIVANPDLYIDAVFSSLSSEFLCIPRGEGFVSYSVFEAGYELLKKKTIGFSNLEKSIVFRTIVGKPMAFVVLRAILGFTPPEWAYIAGQRKKVEITQSFVRSLDRRIRIHPTQSLKLTTQSEKRIKALVETACELLTEGAPEVGSDRIHRLDKADTKTGLNGLKAMAQLGVPYAMVLYERFLGRPFAGHRDSISELVGDVLENAIEGVLTRNSISFRKTKRAERIPGFDQAPDFIIPSEFNPQIVIEAKITEDDGTARDKATRIQHLGEMSREAEREKRVGYEVVACIGGRGFGVRRED